MCSLKLNLDSPAILYKVKGYEALSELFYFDLELDFLDKIINEQEWLHRCLSFSVYNQTFHAEVFEIAHLGFYQYSFHLRPSLAYLSNEKHSRVYQQKTALDIVLNLLKAYQVDISLLRKSTTLRSYCVQYQQSDWSLVERLLAEEQIYYYFRFEENRHILVLQDQKACQYYQYPFYHVSENAEGCLEEWKECAKQGVSQFNSKDYYPYTTEQRYLTVNEENSAFSGQLSYELYPAHFSTHTESLNYLNSFMQSYKQDHGWVEARTTYKNLRLSQLICLGYDPHHYYFLREIYHQAEEHSYYNNTLSESGFYRNKLNLIEGLIFRKKLATKTLIADLQYAKVAGADVCAPVANSMAEIPVLFSWDENGIPVLARIAHLGSTSYQAAQFFPRSGDQVLVGFVNGDPERPAVMGSVAIEQQAPLYDDLTQGVRTQNQQAFNELSFKENADQSKLNLHAAADYRLLVAGNAEITANNSSVTVVEGDVNVTTGECYQVEAKHSICFRAGDSKLQIMKDKIILSANSIRLN